MKYLYILVGLLALSPAMAADGKAILDQQCASCHDLKGPAAQTIEDLWQRKGPDLFYAGSKYKRDWLESWLVKPTRIRIAGHHYLQHIKPGEKQDGVDASTLKPHPAISAKEAKDVAGALMALKGPEKIAGLVKTDDFKGGSMGISFGEMVFDKFNGCMACHQIEPGYGGLSGPEVYTAAQRMQENYLVSFIRNPQAWNPKTPMPNKHTAEPNIQKIVQYLQALSKEKWDDKK